MLQGSVGRGEELEVGVRVADGGSGADGVDYGGGALMVENRTLPGKCCSSMSSRFCTMAPWSFGGSVFKIVEITLARRPTRSFNLSISTST